MKNQTLIMRLQYFLPPIALCIFTFLTLLYLSPNRTYNFKPNLELLTRLLSTFNKTNEYSVHNLSRSQRVNKIEEIISIANSSEWKSLSFIEVLKTFPWSAYETSIKQENRTAFSQYSAELMTMLLPFLTMPPKVQLNRSCIRPPPKIPSHLPKCVNLDSPRNVGVLIQFGFEADILEIHLQELADVVDYFFILESTRSHFLGIPKPLIFEDIKHQNRFKTFATKIIHFVVDDSDAFTRSSVNSSLDGERFTVEGLQERLRWLKFLQWNNATNYFKDDDILGFGDVDEIPSRDVVFYLKHCEMPSDPVDIGIWFPFGKINQAFMTDWPVSNHPFSLGDPTYWTLNAAMNKTQYPSRNRGKSRGYLLGGMHMTHYGYLPNQIVELLTASEANYRRILGYLIPNFHNFIFKEN